MNNTLKINIKIFVHYPEVFNSTVINNRLDEYFCKYFKENKLHDSTYKGESYVVFKTAPHTENQMAIIDLEFKNQIDESINKEQLISEWKKFISVYFDEQIKDIVINFR